MMMTMTMMIMMIMMIMMMIMMMMMTMMMMMMTPSRKEAKILGPKNQVGVRLVASNIIIRRHHIIIVVQQKSKYGSWVSLASASTTWDITNVPIALQRLLRCAPVVLIA